ncbi:MAG: DEAD/DEAH box helicase [Leptospiraceae bacterium]|nr:DEAD/DEAH box helicase [Leptospiraceae bacterium]MCP5484526.1 DEAD/DEAH box helicase [Spirochaetales bacterium]
MNLSQFLDFLGQDAHFASCISGSHTFPEAVAQTAPVPPALDGRIRESLAASGIRELYSHQAEAIDSALAGQDTVVVTPTASGKTLTFLLPIFQRKITNPQSRALLLYPTKALSQDQQAAINRFDERMGTGFRIYTFDGDTPAGTRQRIREAGDFVITNPDMLHSGILPHHTNWIKLFENLDFVVIDELHMYRGVFGSHVANVLRRLLRLCEFYGSRPQFLASSATIANPGEHAERLTGRTFQLVARNGAPRGRKDIIFYNPPVVNQALGVRASAIKEAAALGSYLLKNRISTIFFCRSRIHVELLFTYLRDRCPELGDRIRSYRGGYLPDERRRIERDLREGRVLGVVSTNALELGIDIGMLDVSITVGYPGSISSLLQQFGRSGRRSQNSLSILMATSDGTDQFLATHPDYFLNSNPEQAISNPDNLLIVSDHMKCAAFELPFQEGRPFGNYGATEEILEYLAGRGVLNHSGDRYHWMSDVYPANTFSLRTGARENFAIIDITEKSREVVIGEIDLFAAPVTVHQHAIYIHQGLQYYVEELLWEDRQARVRRINVDYYTDAQDKVDLAVLEDEPRGERHGFELHRGELMIRVKAVMFKKIKLETHENLGWGDIHTPEIEMHTQGAWVLVPPEKEDALGIDSAALGAVLAGAAHAMSKVAPLYVLCDPGDLRARAEVRTATFQLPALYFYDSLPGGLELSYRILENLPVISGAALELVQKCPCEAGCPGCIGLPELEIEAKMMAGRLLTQLAASPDAVPAGPAP